MRLKCNHCDGIHKSMNIHFTGECNYSCPFCIDFTNRCKEKNPPNVRKIINTIIEHQDGFEDVLFLGGEPCLYLEDLLYCVQQVKRLTNLKIYVTTSVPYKCFAQKSTFFDLLELVDGLNISAHHYNEEIADCIRHNNSQYDRQKFYNSLPFKEKIRINLNLVKPYLSTRKDILTCIHHYDEMGFGSILLRELQNSPKYFVSFEDAMGIHMPSPYANGCQTLIDIPGETFSTPIILKRSCFLVEETISVSWEDVLKSFIKIFKTFPENKFGVIWEDGSMTERW